MIAFDAAQPLVDRTIGIALEATALCAAADLMNCLLVMSICLLLLCVL
jgi:hypothetical protein